MPNTTSYVCAHCGQIYDPGFAHVCRVSRLIAEAIAARDKWWVKWFDDLIMGCDGGYGPECKDKPIILDISINQWQSLKQSLEVKE